MSAHTPGPWIREGRLVYALQTTTDRFGRGQQENRFSLSVQPGRGTADVECEANARLITAAPEMLDALGVALSSAEKAVELIHGEYCGGKLDECDECRDELTEHASMRALIARIKGTP